MRTATQGRAVLPDVRRDMVASFPRSALRGLRQRRDFGSVETYCMFVGYPRSGHSLVGSLLSAHPDIVIAHELDALRYVAAGFRRTQLFSLLLDKDRRFEERGRASMEYHYEVPGQWQGRFRTLRVIGDKKGGHSTWRLRERPELLDRLRQLVGVPVRVVHVVRNPYDNITTIAARDRSSLETATSQYFTLAETVSDLAHRLGPDELSHLTHEDFVRDPAGKLGDLCAFVGVEASPDYLEACAATVRPSPTRTRDKGNWTPRLVDEVAGRMAGVDLFDGYSWRE